MEREPAFESLGHKFYTFSDSVPTLPVAREKRYILSLDDLQFNMSKEDAIIYLNGTLSLVDKEPDKAKYLLNVLRDYMTMDWTKNSLFNIASNFILVDDESPDVVTSEHLKIKEYCFRKDKQCEVFFLTIGKNLLTVTNHLSDDTNISEYLNRREVVQLSSLFLKGLDQLRLSTPGKSQNRG